MKILFITNLLPYPTDNGGKIKTYNTLKILSKKNDIDLMCFYEKESDLEGKHHLYDLCNNIDCIKKPITTSTNINYMMKLAIKNLLSSMPLVVYKYMDKQFKDIMESRLDDNDYDVIYVDHLQLAGYLKYINKNKKIYILDEHNAESTIMYRQVSQSKNFIKKLYFYYEYKRLRRFESKVLRSVDKTIVLSQEDKNTLKEISNIDNSKFIQIPIPIEINYIKNNGLNDKNHYNILFLGTLSWFPNSQGIDWFIDKVVPLMEKEDFNYTLYVVGKDPSESLILKSKNNSNIIVTGFVDDVNEYIEKCDFMVVPLFVGSGMRVKILEAMGKNIPVISTTIGCEGIEVKENENILIANDEEQFIDSIKNITNNDIYKKLRVNARQLFKEKYSVEALENLYSEVIRNKGDENVK